MSEYLDYDIERLIVIVQSLVDELKLIKHRAYFRKYYRRHREKIKERVRAKKQASVLYASKLDKPAPPYMLTFD